MNRRKPILVALSLVLSALLRTPPVIAADATDVVAAFDRARETRTPLFITWCADWAPECNHLRNGLFARLEFWDKMKNFEYVAIDSDGDLAQVWGDRIVEKGYPTMLVASPDGIELMRLPAWLPAEQVLEAVDNARALMAPLRDIVAYAESKQGPLTDASWKVLAYHSWSQDRQLDRGPAELERTMRALLKQPIPLHLPRERSRIMTRWLGYANQVAALEQTAGTKTFYLEELDRREADAFLRDMLTDPELFRLNLDFLLFSAANTVELLHPRPSDERTRLIAAWLKAAESVRVDRTLAIDQRAAAMVPKLELFALQGSTAEIPKSLRDDVTRHVADIVDGARQPYERQAAIPTAGWLLERIGDQKGLEKLYRDQLKAARAPYLFMLALARLERARFDNVKALDWSKQAYTSAAGTATRLRFGVEYLKQRLELAPDDVRQVEAELTTFLRSSLGRPDAFDGANGQNLDALRQLLDVWRTKPARSGVVTVIRETFTSQCLKQNSEQRCRDYFAALGR